MTSPPFSPSPAHSAGVRNGIKGNFEQWRSCLAAFTKVTAAGVSTNCPLSNPVVVAAMPPSDSPSFRIPSLLAGGITLPVCCAVLCCAAHAVRWGHVKQQLGASSVIWAEGHVIGM